VLLFARELSLNKKIMTV